jgi:hypothetical protein
MHCICMGGENWAEVENIGIVRASQIDRATLIKFRILRKLTCDGLDFIRLNLPNGIKLSAALIIRHISRDVVAINW